MTAVRLTRKTARDGDVGRINGVDGVADVMEGVREGCKNGPGKVRKTETTDPKTVDGKIVLPNTLSINGL
jgi:hypothetical protein